MRAGDPAPDGSGPLSLARGIEMGHIFQLGRKFAEVLGLKVLDENGKLVTVTMGSYGVGISRAVAAVAEYAHDDLGLAWPAALAPFDVHLVVAGKDQSIVEAGEQLYADLQAAGLDVLFDDRPGKVSPGVKFKDAELIGVPITVVVGRGSPTVSSSSSVRATGDREDVADRRDRRAAGLIGRVNRPCRGRRGPVPDHPSSACAAVRRPATPDLAVIPGRRSHDGQAGGLDALLEAAEPRSRRWTSCRSCRRRSSAARCGVVGDEPEQPVAGDRVGAPR